MSFISKFFKGKSTIINVIRLNGVIASGSKFLGSRNLSLESLEKQIERAFSGKKISGVALIINSPGGSPVQSALISERIIELSKKHNVPVFAFVEDVAASLMEIKRVLKPDGKLLFCEHGLAPEEKVVEWQNRINKFWPYISGGCNINKNIPQLIEEAGFNIPNMEQMYLPKTPKILGYNYWGTAVK